jgi:hypothetical protein
VGLLAEDQRDSLQVMASRFGDNRAAIPQEVTPPSGPFFSAELAARLRQMLAESTNLGDPKPDAMDMLLAERSQRALAAAQGRAGTLIGWSVAYALGTDQR